MQGSHASWYGYNHAYVDCGQALETLVRATMHVDNRSLFCAAIAEYPAKISHALWHHVAANLADANFDIDTDG